MAKKNNLPRDPRYLENYHAKREEVSEAYNKLQKRRPNTPITLNEFIEAGYNRNHVENYFGSLEKLRAFVKERWPNSINYDVKGIRNHNNTKKDMLKWYCEVYNKIGSTITREDVRNDGRYTVNMINNHFGGIEKLEHKARELYPDKFKDISLDSIKSITKIKQLHESIGKYKKFVITTAVAGSEPHMPFLNSLRNFCKINKAKLIVLICEDPGRFKYSKRKKGNSIPKVHKELLNETILMENVWLNENIAISNIKMQAKAIRPTSGFGRIAKKLGSQIYASPKISLEYNSVRNDKNKLPHFIATTGAVTIPNYEPISEYWYQGKRTAFFAENDHKFGASYVEIKDEEIFHYTQIECKSAGGEIFFRDLMYKQFQVPKNIRAEAFVMGDLHAGATNPAVNKCWEEIINITRPKYILIHDGFNGESVNGHISNDIVSKVIRAMEGKDDVVAEIKHFAEQLKFWASKCDELLIVPSNHNDWLERWIRKGDFLKEGNLKNAMPAIEMVRAMVYEKKNPLQFAVEEIAGIKIKNIRWMGRNHDEEIEGIQVNCHGDIGKNGSKGSLMSMVNSYIASFSAHSHTAGILHDAWAVGTSTYLQESYNNGPGTWTNTSGLIYKYGCRALINVICGEWKKV